MYPHPPDLTPCDFWFFLKIKMTMKGKLDKRFESIQDIEAVATVQLKSLMKGLPVLLQQVARMME